MDAYQIADKIVYCSALIGGLGAAILAVEIIGSRRPGGVLHPNYPGSNPGAPPARPHNLQDAIAGYRPMARDAVLDETRRWVRGEDIVEKRETPAVGQIREGAVNKGGVNLDPPGEPPQPPPQLPRSRAAGELPSGSMQDLPRPTTPRPKDPPRPLHQGYGGYQPCAQAETPAPPSVDPDDTLQVDPEEIFGKPPAAKDHRKPQIVLVGDFSKSDSWVSMAQRLAASGLEVLLVEPKDNPPDLEAMMREVELRLAPPDPNEGKTPNPASAAERRRRQGHFPA